MLTLSLYFIQDMTVYEESSAERGVARISGVRYPDIAPTSPPTSKIIFFIAIRSNLHKSQIELITNIKFQSHNFASHRSHISRHIFSFLSRGSISKRKCYR